MKRGRAILVIAVVLGVCMFFCSRLMVREAATPRETTEFIGETGNLLPELDWLKQSLHLTEAQFEKVKTLHLAYRPKCDQLCNRMRDSERTLLAAATKGSEADPELSRALRARIEVQLECQQAMLAHVRQTAACMDPQQARQYLDIVLPYVLGMNSTCQGGHPP